VSASFGALLRRHRLSAQPDGPRARQQACLSQNQFARLAGVDPAYVNRIENRQPGSRGCPQMPSRAVVLRFADALKLDQVQTDELLISAGHCPASIARLDDDRRRALLMLLAR
jgi:transcriptional regulator with XRE-family HTH domain